MLRGPLGEERGAGTARGDGRGGDGEGGGVCGPRRSRCPRCGAGPALPEPTPQGATRPAGGAPECEGALGLGVEREAPSPEIFSAPGNPSGLRVLRPGLPDLPWSSEGNRSLDLIGSA